MNIPRIMIAGTKSGSGKTTITCGIIRALTRGVMSTGEGLNVHAFKCGPDYIDPMFHRSALGVPSKNLDLFFTDEETTRGLFLEGNDGDISVIEGVMGLYDGIGGVSSVASSYHLASVLETPIVLVIDAHGMGRSIIAELRGFLSMDENHLIKGVILNRISASFYGVIAPVIEEELDIKVLGYFPKSEGIKIESRHLGLLLPNEIAELDAMLDKAADIICESVDLKALVDMAGDDEPGGRGQSVISDRWGQGPPITFDKMIGGPCPHLSSTSSKRLAIARDEAFCFYYEDNLRMLEAAGLTLVPFSPIHDEKLPEDIRGLILGGGYPENFLEQLSNNKSMLESIKAAIDRGIPSLAECGGFMYLHEEIKDKDGKSFQMVGVIPGSCEYKDKLVRFGYMTIEEKEGNFLAGIDNRKINGHEFHYYDSTNNGSDCLSVKPSGKRSWESAHVGDNHWWGFAHLYYPSNPEFVWAFAAKEKG